MLVRREGKIVETPTTARKAGPGTTLSREDCKIRWRYAKALIEETPHRSVRDMWAQVKHVYGRGIDINKMYKYAIYLRGSTRPQAKINRKASPPRPNTGTPPSVSVERQTTEDHKPHEIIRENVKILLDYLPNLRKLNVYRPKDGEPKVTYEIVEKTIAGSVTL